MEIQEIQVNIKRKNSVNQKVKARGVVATLAATGSQLNIKAVAKKIFSAKASVRVESERERERGKKYYQVSAQLAERSKPKMDHAESQQQRRSRRAAQRVGSKVA